jgi:hypothetical protein
VNFDDVLDTGWLCIKRDRELGSALVTGLTNTRGKALGTASATMYQYMGMQTTEMKASPSTASTKVTAQRMRRSLRLDAIPNAISDLGQDIDSMGVVTCC